MLSYLIKFLLLALTSLIVFGCATQNINKVKPDFISTGNIGCIMQITNGTDIPILHTVEVIDWYTGGPKPKSLGIV